MPVLLEDREKRTGSSGRRWLWLLAVPPMLGLLLLVVPAVHPVAVPVGTHWLIVKAAWQAGPYSSAASAFGLNIADTTLDAPGIGKWHAPGGWRYQEVRIGQFVYAWGWFRGRRVQ